MVLNNLVEWHQLARDFLTIVNFHHNRTVIRYYGCSLIVFSGDGGAGGAVVVLWGVAQ
jgi:hypothetical protein